MALPTESTLLALDTSYQGQPFVLVESKALNTGSLDFGYLGQPFVGTFTSSSPAYNATQFFLLF
jgi:hypothetical protein